MSVLRAFDMDGTLLAGSSACLELARALGGAADIEALDERFVRGEIDTRGYGRELVRLWPNLTPTVVADAFAASPWLTGIREVCADIRRRGERSAVVTMSPDFFANHLLAWGFDDVVASRFPPLPFAVPVDPTGILTPPDKVRIVQRLRARHGIDTARCVAYGDSMSDAPLFRHLVATVGVNADTHLAGLAAAAYQGSDLAGAYALGRSLLAAAG
ncbi:MAG: HAD family phosphatase [Micromonosporaceae bacterium]|nr:HAD family phosphatase [Micromonosporaceae bacterium]